jgi:hypothetical protein
MSQSKELNPLKNLALNVKPKRNLKYLPTSLINLPTYLPTYYIILLTYLAIYVVLLIYLPT